LLVASQLLTVKLHSRYVKESGDGVGVGVGNFGKVGVGHFTLSIERNPFSAKNQTLRSYRVYISPTK